MSKRFALPDSFIFLENIEAALSGVAASRSLLQKYIEKSSSKVLPYENKILSLS